MSNATLPLFGMPWITNQMADPYNHDTQGAGGGCYSIVHQPTDPIGNTFFIFTVKDSAGNAIINYEYRLYLKSVTAGTIGTTELSGSETQATNPVTLSLPYYSTSQTVELQVIIAGYQESITEFTLTSAAINTTIVLQTESNI